MLLRKAWSRSFRPKTWPQAKVLFESVETDEIFSSFSDHFSRKEAWAWARVAFKAISTHQQFFQLKRYFNFDILLKFEYFCKYMPDHCGAILLLNFD